MILTLSTTITFTSRWTCWQAVYIDATNVLQISGQRRQGVYLLPTSRLQLCNDFLQSSPLHPDVCGFRHGQAAGEVVRCAHDICSLQGLVHLKTTPRQGSVKLVVCDALVRDHLVVQLECALKTTIYDTSLHEACVHLHVQTKSVSLTQVVNHVERHIQATRVAQELHEDTECVVRRADTLDLHLIQDPQGILDSVLLRASVQDRVVHDFIRKKLFITPHLLEHAEGPIHVSLQTVPLDESRIRYDVWLNARLLHVLEEARCTVHRAALRTSVKQGVVRYGVAQDALALHVCVCSKNLVDLTGRGKTL
mmetsp:Transcript_8650/g.24110  ORF Transcript_8650/g.24110 Transcript_8650/m.24110 type:complete len:308 (+) Transcript_8650:88-1011(+)